MHDTAVLARRLSRRTRQSNTVKTIDIAGINERLHGTAAYIAELSGELAVMAGGALSPTWLTS